MDNVDEHRLRELIAEVDGLKAKLGPQKNARRSNIPLYQQTDPKYFPDYQFREYPKVMTDANGEPIVINAAYVTTYKGEQVVRKGRPHLMGGEYLTVANREEEDKFYEQNPDVPRKMTVEVAPQSEADLIAENARLRALLAEHDELERQLAAKSEDPPKPKRGRKPKAEAEKRLTLDEFAGAK